MDRIITILSLFLKLLSIYTVAISLFCIFRPKQYPIAPPDTRFALLIPARNEEAVIGAIVESLRRQNYPADKFRIYVIPNNCTDGTEQAARRAGADILTCTGPVTCKGDVLRQIFSRLRGKYDAYCVFDADNLVHPDFLARMNDAVAAGALCAKGRQMAANPCASWVSGCYDLYFANCMLLHNRPRAFLGLSAKLVGTGFLVTDTLLDRLGGWNTVTLTEDVEFSAQCAAAGIRIHYVPEALTLDEQPTGFRVSMRQRHRWSAGFLHTARLYLPRLLSRHSTWLGLDMAVLLGLFYTQFLAPIPLLHSLRDLPVQDSGAIVLVWLAAFWTGTMVLAFLLSLFAGRDPRRLWKSILLYPLFLASWYLLNLLTLFCPPKAWHPIVHKGPAARQGDKL